MPACCSTTFTTTVRVIDRVHHHAANRRPHTAPTHRTGLADRTQAVLFVAALAQGGTAINVHLPNLARTQTQLGVAAFARQQLDRGTGRARDLRTLARHHLDTVHRATDRDAAQRQAVAGLDRR